jgi:hypothetical protein
MNESFAERRRFDRTFRSCQHDRHARDGRIALPTGASTTAPGRGPRAATARVAGGVLG